MADEADDVEPEALSLTTSSSPRRTLTISATSEESSAAVAEALPKSICPVCSNLGNEIWDENYCTRQGIDYFSQKWARKRINYDAIRAQEGCSGCEILAWALEPYRKQFQDEGLQVGVYLGEEPMHCLTYFSSKSAASPKGIDLVIGSIPLDSSEDLSCPWNFIKPNPIVTCHTGSVAAVGKVQRWYSECLSNHEKCLSGSFSPLPTRIIHIEGPKKAKLYISGTEHAKYACLSHCWGGQSVMLTTTQNIEQYTVDIPWERLPQTFQDAIQFSHSIGFEYLWIDSLCIIQDSTEDWRHEGSRMSGIYANASMTLSATRAENPRQGCFVALDERYISRTRTFTNTDHEKYELHCHEMFDEFETPLFRRGWVFQERMLSRRIIHFMEQELWWECRECFHCECNSFRRSSSYGRQNLGSQLSKLSSCENIEIIERIWENLVTEYSSKSLTYPSDIFPAIQALAKLIPSNMGRYLAGHWESTLIWSLCWWKYSPKTDEHMGWRAPSWSWAATQGKTTWRHPSQSSELKACATLISAQTTPEGDDPMGQISYGFIIVRGNLLVGEIQPAEREGEPYHNLILEGALIDSFHFWSVYWDGKCPNKDRKQVFALKLLEEDDTFGETQYWLILTAVEGTESEYVRIGILSAWINRFERTDSYIRVLDAMNEAEETDVKIV